MALFQLPFFAELAKSQRVLLAGAGGGFDLFTGLPLYFALREAGKQVFLANLSFTSIYATNGRRSAPALVEVTAHTYGSETYLDVQRVIHTFRASLPETRDWKSLPI